MLRNSSRNQEEDIERKNIPMAIICNVGFWNDKNSIRLFTKIDFNFALISFDINIYKYYVSWNSTIFAS